MTRNLSLLALVFVAFFCASSCSWSEGRAHEPCYDIRSPNTGGNWTTEGSAQASETGIDLTLTSGVGSMWNQQPVDFSNWELELDFEILPSGPHGGHADGLGVFYVQEPKHGRTFGTIPEFVGLGIVFDTYRNGEKRGIEPPFLQAHVLNGSVPHAWNEDGYPSALVSIHAPVLGKSNSKLKVRYQDNALVVTMKYKEANAIEWLAKDFQIQDVDLPRGYYFGIGATCGGSCSNHRVLGLKVYSLDGPGPESNSTEFPRPDSDELFQGNEYVCWNRFSPETVSSSAVVLGYTIGSRPVFFARVVAKGRTSPALYIPSLNKGIVYAFPDGQITIVRAENAEILSYRYSRSSHLLWQRYPTERLESKSFIDRLVAVGYSNEGDVLSICRSEPQESENSSGRMVASGLGVFSVSSGVCRYVNQIGRRHLEVRTTPRFSMSFTLPTDASQSTH